MEEIMELFEGIEQINGIAKFFINLFVFSLGAYYCFWGYKMFRTSMAIMGFFNGISLGLFLSSLSILIDHENLELLVVSFILFPVIFGIAGALLSWFLYKAAVAANTFLISYSILVTLSMTSMLISNSDLLSILFMDDGERAALVIELVVHLLWPMIPAGFFAYAVVKNMKPILIILTALQGASIISGIFASFNLALVLIAFVVTAVLGIKYQCFSSGGFTERVTNEIDAIARTKTSVAFKEELHNIKQFAKQKGRVDVMYSAPSAVAVAVDKPTYAIAHKEEVPVAPTPMPIPKSDPIPTSHTPSSGIRTTISTPVHSTPSTPAAPASAAPSEKEPTSGSSDSGFFTMGGDL